MIPLPKLKAILLYFAHNTERLGAVKLNKLFYFLDFGFVKQHAVPITYDLYLKKKNGPVPSAINDMVHLIADEETSEISDTIEIVKISPRGRVNKMNKIVPKRKITNEDLELLSSDEIKWLNKVCAKYRTATADEIEKASHDEAPWQEANMNGPIPYTFAAHDPDCLVTKREIELALG